MRKLRWLVGLTEPALSDQPIWQITAADFLQLLRKVESKGTYESSRRLSCTLASILQYGIATSRGTADPAEALRGALIRLLVKPRVTLLDRHELGDLLNRIGGFIIRVLAS